MMFAENHPLKDLNSFHCEANARYYTIIENETSFEDFFKCYDKSLPFLILGGGNNILFTNDFPGYVLKIQIKGIEIINENEDFIWIKAKAGEDWDSFVKYCVENNYGGLENLSLIPGQVGSCPIQNIGAYGVEVKDVISEVRAYNYHTSQYEHFDNDACCFEYRSSIFKTTLKNSHIITAVTFKLNKKPLLNISYEAIQKEIHNRNIQMLDLMILRQVVCDIRSSKLPDTKETGNAGSFFKNPVIAKTLFDEIKKSYPDIVSYELESGDYKIAAGWLIEKCGFKGYRLGDAGVHTHQALVLVNYGNASGNEIISLAENIRKNVYDVFGIQLEFEVNII